MALAVCGLARSDEWVVFHTFCPRSCPRDTKDELVSLGRERNEHDTCFSMSVLVKKQLIPIGVCVCAYCEW